MALILGRILLAAIFVISGALKVLTFSQTSQRLAREWSYMSDATADAMLAFAVLAELGGGLLLLTGLLPRLGAILLFLYMIPATLIFHDFWTFQGEMQRMQIIQFMKNLSIMGGLLIVIAEASD